MEVTVRRNEFLAVRSRTSQGSERRSELVSSVLDAYVNGYRAAFGSDRDVRWIDLAGQEHVFDATTGDRPDEPAPRLLAVASESTDATRPRDTRFMRGFPLPAGPFDRGHLLARQAGGLEGVGLNLVPQDSQLNRGRTRDGRRWRSLEQHAAANPGTMCVVRVIYDDDTDIPAWFEVVQIELDGTATVDRFPNRRGLP